MFHSYRPVPLAPSPRDKYLAALAAAQAAEAEYLAAERLKQEEEAIRLRLRQIEALKHPSYHYASPSFNDFGHYAPQAPVVDIEALRREIALEERQRILREQEQERRAVEARERARRAALQNAILSEQATFELEAAIRALTGRSPAPLGNAPNATHHRSSGTPKQSTSEVHSQVPSKPVSQRVQVATPTKSATRTSSAPQPRPIRFVVHFAADEPVAESSKKASSAAAPKPLKGKAPAPVNTTTTSTAEIQAVDAAFTALANEWIFPEQVDFSTSRSSSPAARGSAPTEGDSVMGRLTYSTNNQPVRFYHQSLSKLLARLDAVESFGDEQVRHARKEVVAKVEAALDEVESVVEARWRRLFGREERSSEPEAALLPEQLPVDVDVVPEPTNDAPAVKSDAVDAARSQDQAQVEDGLHDNRSRASEVTSTIPTVLPQQLPVALPAVTQSFFDANSTLQKRLPTENDVAEPSESDDEKSEAGNDWSEVEA
ncbi:BAG domain-containing protein [Mycena chlorophos]|uniref:BAG domain-containing protein n=1 Tax=Mycena chlorophos TaxID=658473 RepID=A0A8H6S274_MYCCL|nr:BAG domain-containing protein [Mycena chlorophos]